MKKIDEVQKDKKPKKVSKKTILKWVGIGSIVLVVFIGFQYFSFTKKAEARREAQMEQEQLLVSHWEEQGFSEEEIQKKLRESRSEVFNAEDVPLVKQLLRSFRHATGIGPGVGGTGPRDGSGMGMRNKAK